jgi:hypothetical protein
MVVLGEVADDRGVTVTADKNDRVVRDIFVAPCRRRIVAVLALINHRVDPSVFHLAQQV